MFVLVIHSGVSSWLFLGAVLVVATIALGVKDHRHGLGTIVNVKLKKHPRTSCWCCFVFVVTFVAWHMLCHSCFVCLICNCLVCNCLPTPPPCCLQCQGCAELILLLCNCTNVSLWLSTTRRRPTMPMCVCRASRTSHLAPTTDWWDTN